MANFLYAILLFGLVIFVHELGHFLVARRFNVKIFVFSLGFGSSLVSWRRGETEYRISAVPLGGYVKMLGEDTPEEEIPLEDLPRSFQAKVWWQKCLIVLAGPTMNILFALLIYLGISFFNYTSDATVVEFVALDSAAQKAGLHEGDRIIAMNGTTTAVWEDVQNALPEPVNGACAPLTVTAARWPSGTAEQVIVAPEKRRYADVLGDETERCVMGIAALPRDARLAFAGPVEKLKGGDLLRMVDGKPITRWYEAATFFTPAAHTLRVERDGKEVELSLTAEESAQTVAVMRQGGMLVGRVDDGSVAKKADIQPGDLIVEANNIPVVVPFEFESELKKAKEGDTVRIALYRGGERLEKEIVIAIDSKDNQYTGQKETKVRWGAQFLFNYNIDPTQVRRADPVSYSLRYAVGEAWNISVLTVKGMYYLIAGKLSAKSLGGPILVFDISQKAAERGAKVFLSVMAMISINLGILNLLPVPVLDGGHMVMYAWEGLTRRKIPVRVKEWSLRVGVALLMALMVFAMFNDISRYISIFRNG